MAPANVSPDDQVILPFFTLHTVLILGARSTGALWRSWIETEPDLYVIGDAGMNLASASRRVNHPDVILFQIVGPPARSNATLDYLRHVFPDTQLLLAASGEESFCELLRPAGQVRGLMQSDASPEMLVRAIRIVSTGGTFFLGPMRS
jgi:DNA-binding NarL/FixJ family response regulator